MTIRQGRGGRTDGQGKCQRGTKSLFCGLAWRSTHLTSSPHARTHAPHTHTHHTPLRMKKMKTHEDEEDEDDEDEEASIHACPPHSHPREMECVEEMAKKVGESSMRRRAENKMKPSSDQPRTSVSRRYGIRSTEYSAPTRRISSPPPPSLLILAMPSFRRFGSPHLALIFPPNSWTQLPLPLIVPANPGDDWSAFLRTYQVLLLHAPRQRVDRIPASRPRVFICGAALMSSTSNLCAFSPYLTLRPSDPTCPAPSMSRPSWTNHPTTWPSTTQHVVMSDTPATADRRDDQPHYPAQQLHYSAHPIDRPADHVDSGDHSSDQMDYPADPTTADIQRRKAKRFRLTHSQTRLLQSHFAIDSNPNAAQRDRLAGQIPGLSPRQVQVWFQNRYRSHFPRHIRATDLPSRAKLKRMSADDQALTTGSRALPELVDVTYTLHPPHPGVAASINARTHTLVNPTPHLHIDTNPFIPQRASAYPVTSAPSHFGPFGDRRALSATRAPALHHSFAAMPPSDPPAHTVSAQLAPDSAIAGLARPGGGGAVPASARPPVGWDPWAAATPWSAPHPHQHPPRRYTHYDDLWPVPATTSPVAFDTTSASRWPPARLPIICAVPPPRPPASAPTSHP